MADARAETTTQRSVPSALVTWLRERRRVAVGADRCDDLQREQRSALRLAGRIRPR